MPVSAVTYSAHAIDRMDERSISWRQVEVTIQHPDKIQRQGAKVIAVRTTARGNTIQVVYEHRVGPAGRTAHVITVIRISPR